MTFKASTFVNGIRIIILQNQLHCIIRKTLFDNQIVFFSGFKY